MNTHPAHDPALLARLTDLIEGELPPEALAEVEGWLVDDELRRDVEDARVARTLLADIEPVPVPADFARKVQRRARRLVRRNWQQSQDIFGFKISVEVFAIIAVAVMAALYTFGHSTRPFVPGPLYEVTESAAAAAAVGDVPPAP